MANESDGVYVHGCRFCGRPCPVSEFCSVICEKLWTARRYEDSQVTANPGYGWTAEPKPHFGWGQ